MSLKSWAKKTREALTVSSSQGGDARRLWNEGSSYLTKQASKAGMDKPGGDVKKLGDMTERAGMRFSKTIHGKWDNDYGSNTSTDDISEPGTKATLARSRKDLYENSNKNRRIVAHTDVNKTKGKKAKQLSRIRGGR